MAIDGNTPVLPDAEMRALGFTDRSPDRWHLCRPLLRDVTFNITITKASGNYSELVMDEDFGQPFHYGHAKTALRDYIRSTVDGYVAELMTAGLTVAVDHEAYGVRA